VEKIVVTGSQGFVGSHLVRRLKKLGHTMCPIDLNYKPDPIDLTSYIDTKRHFEELTSCKTNPVLVFDLATLPLPLSLKQPYEVAYKIYCMGTVLCELLREGYIKKLIHISSSEVFEPNTPYAAAKDAQDKLILSYAKSFGLNACIARPFNTYGPGQDLGAIIPATIKKILSKQQPVLNGDGSQERDFIYVDDTVEGILWVGDNGERGKQYNITTEECRSMAWIIDTIVYLMKYKGKILHGPERPGDTKIIHGKSDIPLKCKFGYIKGLERTIKWWKNSTLLTTQD